MLTLLEPNLQFFWGMPVFKDILFEKKKHSVIFEPLFFFDKFCTFPCRKIKQSFMCPY